MSPLTIPYWISLIIAFCLLVICVRVLMWALAPDKPKELERLPLKERKLLSVLAAETIKELRCENETRAQRRLVQLLSSVYLEGFNQSNMSKKGK